MDGIRISPLPDSKLKKFEAWLCAHGAELLAPTNEYEVVRFQAGKMTHIIYRNGKGHWTAVNGAEKALQAFLSGGSWTAPIKRGNGKAPVSKIYLALVRRDGSGCFYCGSNVETDDASTEHLLPASLGGPNHLANLALAHKRCNQEAGNLSIVEKVRLRDQIRGPGVSND